MTLVTHALELEAHAREIIKYARALDHVASLITRQGRKTPQRSG